MPRSATRRARAAAASVTAAVAPKSTRRGRPVSTALTVRFDNPAILAAVVAAVDAALAANSPEMPAIPSLSVTEIAADGTESTRPMTADESAVALSTFRDEMAAYPAAVAAHNAATATLSRGRAALDAPTPVSRKATGK